MRVAAERRLSDERAMTAWWKTKAAAAEAKAAAAETNAAAAKANAVDAERRAATVAQKLIERTTAHLRRTVDDLRRQKAALSEALESRDAASDAMHAEVMKSLVAEVQSHRKTLERQARTVRVVQEVQETFKRRL